MVYVSPQTSHSGWSNTVASRCQLLAGRACDPRGLEPAEYLPTLTTGLPRDLAIAERLAIRNVLTTMLARLMCVAVMDERSAAEAIFFTWAACDVTSPSWHDDLQRFLVGCAEALSHSGSGAPRVPIGDMRVARALRIIESRYADPDLSLAEVAGQAGLSVRHAARLLKRFTGSGLTTHVHRRRIAAAERLLDDRSLSVKEIAIAVGYSTPSQFCWHFKRLMGTAPAQFRSKHCLRQIAG
jgi:AraC-like DNA-binding protein